MSTHVQSQQVLPCSMCKLLKASLAAEKVMIILAALNAGAVLLTLLPGASAFRRRMKLRMRFCTSSPFRPGMSTVPLNISMVPAFTSFSLMLRHRLCIKDGMSSSV